MAAIWESYYHTGIPEIDRQHKELLMVARRIITIIDQEDSQIRRMFAATEGIKYLKSYMFQHFADEEAYMKKACYKDYGKHKLVDHIITEDMEIAGKVKISLDGSGCEQAPPFSPILSKTCSGALLPF